MNIVLNFPSRLILLKIRHYQGLFLKYFSMRVFVKYVAVDFGARSSTRFRRAVFLYLLAAGSLNSHCPEEDLAY